MNRNTSDLGKTSPPSEDYCRIVANNSKSEYGSEFSHGGWWRHEESKDERRLGPNIENPGTNHSEIFVPVKGKASVGSICENAGFRGENNCKMVPSPSQNVVFVADDCSQAKHRAKKRRLHGDDDSLPTNRSRLKEEVILPDEQVDAQTTTSTVSSRKRPKSEDDEEFNPDNFEYLFAYLQTRRKN